MKKNRLGHRYIELKNCIVFLTKRKRKREEGFFLIPTIWFSRCNFFKNDYVNVYFLPRTIEFTCGKGTKHTLVGLVSIETKTDVTEISSNKHQQ